MSAPTYVDPTTGKAIRNPYRENSDFVRFGLRILRALSRRAGADVDALPAIAEMRDGLDELLRQSIETCRAEGYSWADIGERLGVTRQTAWERYGRPSVKRAG